MPKYKVFVGPLKVREDVSVDKKRVKQANGRVISLHSVSAESPDFSSELTAVFSKNVKKARRANFKLKLNPELVRKAKLLPSLDRIEAALVRDKRGPKRKREKQGTNALAESRPSNLPHFEPPAFGSSPDPTAPVKARSMMQPTSKASAARYGS